MKKEMRGNLVYWLSVGAAAVSLTALVILVALEVYVRWTVNQDFSFLGGSGLLGLCILVLGLILGLIYSQKS